MHRSHSRWSRHPLVPRQLVDQCSVYLLCAVALCLSHVPLPGVCSPASDWYKTFAPTLFTRTRRFIGDDSCNHATQAPRNMTRSNSVRSLRSPRDVLCNPNTCTHVYIYMCLFFFHHRLRYLGHGNKYSVSVANNPESRRLERDIMIAKIL